MRIWEARVLHTDRCCLSARQLLAVVLLFLAIACGNSRQPTPPLDRFEWCSPEERSAVAQASAPRRLVPGATGCTVQLQILSDEAQYGHDDLITVTARLNLQGDCSLTFVRRMNFYDFSVQVLDQLGQAVPLAPEGQLWEERRTRVIVDGGHRGGTLTTGQDLCWRLPIDRWYNLAPPGTYTLTLEYLGVVEMGGTGGVISNPITFTRRP